ncbi:MAG: hypothetical protein JO176_15920, partial [Acidimicrobiia bacterium]|nr:hypothetical protein [Acidimicrobiia bacterium]
MSSDEPRWTPVPPVPGSLEALQAEVASLRAEVDRLRAGQRDRAADDFDRLLRPRRNWRRLLGALLLILACILSPLAIFSVWLRAQVTDTNRYVQNVAPLSHNKDIDAAVAAKITNELFASVDVRALAQQALPPQGQFLAGPLTSGLRTFTQQTAARVFESPQFNKLWKDANRVAHGQVVAIVKGKSGGIVTAKDGRVVLDLGALVARVQTELHANGVNLFDGLKVNSTFELVQSTDLARASNWVRYLEAAAVILPVGVIAAFAVALFLSDDRRRTLLRGGLGVAFAMVVMLALLYAGRAIFVDSVAGPDVPHAAAAAFFDTVVRFLRTGLRAGFTAGLVIAAGAWVTSAHVTAVRLRTTCGRLLTGVAAREDWEFGATGVWVAAHKRLLRYAISIVGALVLVVMKHPGPKGVIVVTLFVLVGAAAVEVVGRAVSTPPDAGTTQPRLFD